ncbi:hypothetical protein [Thermomonas sp. HDW16]|uniref:hypothetical protein n=1 Tax=Thermomonas sp. HDW16 TaxID=2714945 RepID=UPI00140C176A|nr:hypothetical protein [Thermomonas sp. HDW16]QIL19485.1 hypothetical protein G7079_01340 [Thermomonas sp. HDW16]
MKLNRLHMAMLAAVLGSAALVGCKKKEEPVPPPAVETAPAPAPTPAPMAATAMVNSVDLGNAVGADMRVSAPMTTFSPKDANIYAAVSTGTSDPAASVTGKLGAKWTHVDSNQTVHEESKDMTFAGDGVTDFQISKPDGWPTGKYKVEVSLDGAVVQTREFEVK